MVFDLTLSDSSEKHKCSDVAEAVSGLTSLVRAKTTGTQGGAHSTGSLSSSEADDDEEMEREGDEASAAGGDFLIPQRLTRSGRKRAVPFPLKVRTQGLSL